MLENKRLLLRFICKILDKSKQKIKNNMKRYSENSLRKEYSSPVLEVIEIATEGVLCASGEFGIDDWTNDNDGLDF